MTIRKVAILFLITFGAMFTALLIAPEQRTSAAVLATPAPTPAGPGEKKGFSGYRGVMIGQSADEVRTKLGAPKEKADEQDMYIFSETESAQFFYDAAHTVSAIMITYTGVVKDELKPVDLFGEDAPAKPDGGVFKMERYPKAGFWISYNKSPGTDAVVSIAVQKIPH